ncbi:MAG: hypothetical protein NXI32_31305, partial [bacterium]|nr:hypothetical protein [bacterium]
AFKMKDFSLTITNNMILDDFHNSLTRAEMPLITQTFELTHTTPWDDPLEAAKVGTELSDVAISLNFVSGTKQILFEFPSMYEGEMDEPEVATQQRVRKQYSWKAKYDPADAIAAPVRFTVVET